MFTRRILLKQNLSELSMETLVKIMETEEFQYASESGRVDPMSEEDVRRWYRQQSATQELRTIIMKAQQSKQETRLYWMPVHPMAEYGKDEQGQKVSLEYLFKHYDEGTLSFSHNDGNGSWFLMQIQSNGALETISATEMQERFQALLRQQRIQARLVRRLVHAHAPHRLENLQLKELNRRVETQRCTLNTLRSKEEHA